MSPLCSNDDVDVVISDTTIQREQALLGFALSQSRMVFYIAELEDQTISYISPNIETLSGHSPEAILADTHYWRRLLHPDDSADFEQATNLLRAKGTHTFAFRLQSTTGHYIWLQAEQRLTYNAALDAHEIIGSLVDITAEKQPPEPTPDQASMTRTLLAALESLPNGFSINDADGNLLFCNQAFAELYDKEPDALIGHPLTERIQAYLPKVARLNGKPVTGSKQDVADWAARLSRIDSEPIELELHSGEWKLITGRLTPEGGYVTIRTDITEQKKAEMALRESKELFWAFYENAPLAMNFKDLDGRYQILNKQFAQWFGLTGDAIVGKTMADIYTPEYAEIYTTMEQEAFAQKRAIRRELMVPCADGELHPMAVIKFPVFDTNGQPLGSGTIDADISSHKQHEAELRHSRETLEDAIESLSEGFALYDADDRLVMCNSRYREFNLASADMLKPGVTWADVIRTGGERGQYRISQDKLASWLEEQFERRQELDTKGKDKFEVHQADDHWYEVSIQKTRQGGMVVVREDITERKELEHSLRSSEALVRHVLEACPVPITMNRIDDGIIIYENPAAQALLQYTESQEGQSVIHRWVNPDDRKAYLQRLRRSGAVDGLEVHYRKAGGEEVWCAMSSRLIDYRGEEVIVSNLFDLTERRAADAQLARQREMLHQSEKLSALGELLASVAHELNNPLSVVTGQALLLQETCTDERTATRALKIGNAAERCARIVKTFLAMARQKPSTNELVNLNEIVETSLDVTAYALRSSDINVVLRLSPDLEPFCGDEDQLNQVLINLILNAQQALEEKSGPKELIISTAANKRCRQLILSVEDNGPGIPSDIRSRIFEPFFTTKKVGTGTGIGLALCHRVVESHEGTISVDSTVGLGTSFTIRLPAARHCYTVTPSVDETSADAANTLSVLVVDDETDVANLLADILRNQGHCVETADSGMNALHKIDQNDFDIILSDLRMPNLDGPGLYRALQECRPEMLPRLAFMTGDTLGVKARTFLQSIDIPYIEKPITPQDIRDLLNRLRAGTPVKRTG